MLMCINGKKTALVATLVAFALGAGAGTFKWTGGANNDDWSDGGNYEGGVAPGAGDIVTISNMTATISSDNAASWATASALDRIAPQDTNTTIVIYVAEGVTNDFGAGISRTASSLSRQGLVEKTGAGAVNFLKATGGQYDFRGHEFHVKAGWANFGKTDKTQYFNVIRIDEGARMTVSKATTWTRELLGPGDIDCAANNQFRVSGGTATEPTVAEAKLGYLHYCAPGYVRILRTDNAAVKFSVYDGVTELIDIGMNNVPSPTGKNTYLSYIPGGASPTFRYIGTTDTVTDKEILYENSGSSAAGVGVFDAGPHGGITFNGKWDWETRTWGVEHLLIRFDLIGSNTVPCAINGRIGLGTNPSDTRTGAIGLSKKGSGCWRLANTNNFFTAPIYVEEGTLEFANIKEKGERCALGTATELKDLSTPGVYDVAADVPYALRLGSAAVKWPADGLATLRYIGATQGICRTRPVALGGDARLLNTSGQPFRLSGISAVSNGVSRLVLAGTGENDEVQNLIDGTGGCRLGVVKEGSGTWTLGGTNSFSGPVVVNGGTLKVRREYKYTWYKLVVRDLWSRLDTTGTIEYDQFRISRIGLFDAQGKRHNIGFTQCDEFPVNFALAPGQIGFGMPKPSAYWIRSPGMLPSLCFTGGADNDHSLYMTRSDMTIDPEKESDWISIEMRMTNGTPEIAYYDIGMGTKLVEGQADGNRNIRAWDLMGSTDGWHWQKLHSIDDSRSDDPNQILKQRPYSWVWMGQYAVINSAESADTVHDTTKLQPIDGHLSDPPPMPLANVEYVSVAQDAVLEADGDITLSSFKVSGTGAGTIRGFSLAPSCSVDVVDVPDFTGCLNLGLTFDGSSPADSAWTLTVDGAPSRKYRLKATNDGLSLVTKGMLVSFK